MAVGAKPHHSSAARRPTLSQLAAVVLLCSVSYLVGVWHHGGFTPAPASSSPSVSIATTTASVTCVSPTPSALARGGPSGPLDFAAHHAADAAEANTTPTQRVYEACPAKYSEHTPCEDVERSLRFPRDRLVYRERHCPADGERLRCLVPAPRGYRNPFPWPASRDVAWFANVPHKELTVEKAVQNWIRVDGDKFRFPGGGTMFPHGAGAYIDDIGKLIPLHDGSIRTALDTGCGVASWGAYLLSRNILAMSFAPRDSHEAQVQFALERGVPAMIGVFASNRLPYPARAFDMAHCSRCLIPWQAYDGLYLIEVDRILRPGGYWILSGPPINWKKHFKGWQRTKEDLNEEQQAIESVAKSLCWKKIKEVGDIAIWQKPTNHMHCKASRRVIKSLPFCSNQNPDAAWYDKMEACITPLPEVSDIKEVAGGELKKWPQRLTAVPPRIASGSIEGVTAEMFEEDTKLWKKRVGHYKSVISQFGQKGRYRNLLDMNARFGGFAAALAAAGDPMWVMNMVPTLGNSTTLGVIYERGLIGNYQDCRRRFSWSHAPPRPRALHYSKAPRPRFLFRSQAPPLHPVAGAAAPSRSPLLQGIAAAGVRSRGFSFVRCRRFIRSQAPARPRVCLNGMADVRGGLEEWEEYYNVVSQTFRTEEEGYKFYNSYAKHKGFGIRRDNKDVKEDTGVLFRRRFVCCKEGYRSKKNFEKPNPKRTPRPLSRCGCKAYLLIELNMKSGEWFVKNFDEKHNHPLTKPDQTPFLWSHRGMNDAQKADAVEFAVGGLRTHQIMEVMEKTHGGYRNLGFVSRDLYNFMAEEKKEMIDGLDAQYMLNYMAAAKEKDPDFFFRYTTGIEGHLQNIFWADPQSRLDFKAFGGVVVFDSTYRSNKYKLPFVPFVGLNQHRSTIVFAVGLVSDESFESYEWLLRAFLEAMHQEHPRSVITDGDAAMAKAISRIWPNTDHRLCSWHIEENMVRHLRKKKLADFKKFVYQVTEVDEFERLWVVFKKKYRVGKKDAWIRRMYELREKWSTAYTKGRYFLGMRSNQRSESLNSRLHVHLKSNMKLVDLIQHYEHCVSVLRRKAAALDSVASQTVPFTRLTADSLEISASYIYTPVIFKQVKDQILGVCNWEVVQVAEENGLIKYEVGHKLSVDRRFDVRCAFLGSLLDTVNCQCRKMESEDIPCRHIFTVLKYLGLQSIPACCVMERWTMKANLAFDPARHANTRVWSERMDNYHELRNKASFALFKASSNPEQIQRVNDFLNSIMDFQPEDGEDDENNKTSTFGPLPAYFSGAKQTLKNKVLDPKRIIPKGKPKGKKSDKRFKPFHENFKGKKKPRKAPQTRKQN